MIEYNKTKKYQPIELMELAYQESLFSIHEHQNKPDPLVGAILTTSDGLILATAHRGELRIGEHCEYTLIERKLKSENLMGCHLYVTLEPCIDKVRSKPKRGCATHIKKARITKVYIGIRDPDIDIENQGVNFLLDNGIQAIDFPAEINLKIRESLQQFIEYKEAEKLKKLKVRKAENIPYLNQSSISSSLSEFSTNAINQFIKYSNASFKFPSDSFTNWSLSFELATKIGKEIVATKLGMLLFGDKVDEIYPQSIFKVEIDYGANDVEIKDFGGPISTQLEKVLDFVKSKGLKLTIDRTDSKRKQQTNFPMEILREVIANAIIHRDYSIDSSTNYIYINADKIIIKSPGLPVAPLTIEDIRTMDLPSISRNPKIMYVYNRMGMAEQRGIGLRSLKSLSDFGLPLPLFKLVGNIMEITFARSSKLLPEIAGYENLDLSAKYREGLYFIQKNEPITVNDYSLQFQLTSKTAQRHLAKLAKLGLILKEGDKRWTKYRTKL